MNHNCDPLFYVTYLLTEPGQRELHREKKEIARANLSLQNLKDLRIPKAPICDQSRVVNILQFADDKLAAEEDRLTALQVLFKSMLNQLMTGQIRLIE